jgi:hypothetical protein
MHLSPLLWFIILCHTSVAFSRNASPNQVFKLPAHPSNWICTVHITVATLANHTSSDITERFLTSNHEQIIPTVSTMLNRSISTAPVISFFEPCTISILMDATINGSSYIETGIERYIDGNEYVYRGWRHSVIIVIYFTCENRSSRDSLYLPHRLFYHSTECGPQNTFPNHAFVPDSLQRIWPINDPTHTIHSRQLPVAIRNLISKPKYNWDEHDPHLKQEPCSASRWDTTAHSPNPCSVRNFAVYNYQYLLNFTAVAVTKAETEQYGRVCTSTIDYNIRHTISLHSIDSMNIRIIYCEQNLVSTKLRPVDLLSPFSFETWLTLAIVLIICAILNSFAIFYLNSAANKFNFVSLIRRICNSLVDHSVLLLEQDLGKPNTTKIFIGLIVVFLSNMYRNHLTIDLVYPRAEDPIQNVTELLDLKYNLIYLTYPEKIGQDKSRWLKDVYIHMEIDESKRQKYMDDVDRWFQFLPRSQKVITRKLTSKKEKNAWVAPAPKYLQLYWLNRITETIFPVSCRFVGRPFPPRSQDFYFFNAKAEEFKWLTKKFLTHGLVEAWKRLEVHQLLLLKRRDSVGKDFKSSNSTWTESFELRNFIGHIHLSVFFLIVSMLFAICIVVFAFECRMMPKAQRLSSFVVAKLKHFILELLWTMVRSIFLITRFILSRISANHNNSF